MNGYFARLPTFRVYNKDRQAQNQTVLESISIVIRFEAQKYIIILCSLFIVIIIVYILEIA